MLAMPALQKEFLQNAFLRCYTCAHGGIAENIARSVVL